MKKRTGCWVIFYIRATRGPLGKLVVIKEKLNVQIKQDWIQDPQTVKRGQFRGRLSNELDLCLIIEAATDQI